MMRPPSAIFFLNYEGSVTRKRATSRGTRRERGERGTYSHLVNRVFWVGSIVSTENQNQNASFFVFFGVSCPPSCSRRASPWSLASQTATPHARCASDCPAGCGRLLLLARSPTALRRHGSSSLVVSPLPETQKTD